MRRGLSVWIAFLWALLTALSALIYLVGQRHAWVAPLVYVPAHLWAGVSLVLLLGACFANRWLVLLCALTAWGHLGVFYRDDGSKHVPETADVLRVVTCNRGQHAGHQIEPFIDQMQADVVVLQESSARQQLPLSPSLTQQSKLGEFVLLSRYPILNTQAVVRQMNGKRWFRAARFEVKTPARTVVIYNVHLPSPRKELKNLRPGTSAQMFWYDQEALMEEVLQLIEAETVPVIVCGDWNVPPLGPLYRRMTEQLSDAHLSVGSGAGYTFPGDVWNPLSLGKPWLRLDYILCNAECEVLRCETEAPSASQHSAVGAVLRIK
jgi:endonuclease/exonuclease/phosphatase family metal-dependent hydrolase